MEPHAFLPDWRDVAAYAQLAVADRSILAWEWLRRVPGYRQEACDALRTGVRGDAARWGLHRFEDPAVGAPEARPIWTASAYDPVLVAVAFPAPAGQGLDCAGIADLVTVHAEDAAERVLLSDGLRALRIDTMEGTLGKGRVSLRFAVEGPPRLTAPLLALRRFDALGGDGRFRAALHPREPRVARLVQLLRTADALAAGANQRAIAAELLCGDVGAPGWREVHPELRLRAQRLVRDARACLAGGYRALLDPLRTERVAASLPGGRLSGRCPG